MSPPQISTQDRADYLKAAACMRDHGIVGFPDPVVSGDNVNFPIHQGMNTKSTQFLRARDRTRATSSEKSNGLAR